MGKKGLGTEGMEKKKDKGERREKGNKEELEEKELRTEIRS